MGSRLCNVFAYASLICGAGCLPVMPLVGQNCFSLGTCDTVTIFGGEVIVAHSNSHSHPVVRSTVALLSTSDFNTEHALVEGSGTLIAPNVIVGAAHTCLNFAPRFVSFGSTLPQEDPWERYSQGAGTAKYPMMRQIVSCIAHPAYNVTAAHNEDDQNVVPVNDIALFFINDTPAGFVPAHVLAPDAQLPIDVSLAGFGAHEGQFDFLQTSGMEPYDLRVVSTFITQAFARSLQFQDGPNPGKGSCQGDSGGSVYRRISSLDTALNFDTIVPVLVGIPVNGPECDKGIGINTDIRPFVAWIEKTARIALSLKY